MFFSDDFWGLLALVGVGVASYSKGKQNGVQQTVAHYDAQAVISAQQEQINLLHAKLDAIQKTQVMGQLSQGVKP
jgi:hypothetical protein